MIDAHQHFWTTKRDDYGWLTPEDATLYRDFGPDDLAPLIGGAGISRTVLVQAAPTVAETRFLLGIADRTEWVAGVVGWVALDEPGVEAHLDSLLRSPHLRGVRPMIQDIPDDDWMLREALAPGLQALRERALCFDALVHPRHLPRLLELLRRHPELRTVVDHAAKPEIRAGGFDGWAEDIAAVAGETDAFCKLSGLVTEAAPDWRPEDLRPYVAHLVECFGPERLMWGSDWPVVELAGGFERWRDASLALLSELDEEGRAAILGDTASRFYDLAARPAHPLAGAAPARGDEG